MKTHPLRCKLRELDLNDQGKRPVLVERLSEYYANLEIDPSESEWLDADNGGACLPLVHPITINMLWEAISTLTQSVCELNSRLSQSDTNNSQTSLVSVCSYPSTNSTFTKPLNTTTSTSACSRSNSLTAPVPSPITSADESTPPCPVDVNTPCGPQLPANTGFTWIHHKRTAKKKTSGLPTESSNQSINLYNRFAQLETDVNFENATISTPQNHDVPPPQIKEKQQPTRRGPAKPQPTHSGPAQLQPPRRGHVQLENMNFQQQTHIHRQTQQQQQSPLPETTSRQQQTEQQQQEQRNMNIVPGIKTYAQITSDKEITTIVTDSLCRSIRVRKFNDFLDSSKQKVNINKFPGATAKQIRHYAQYTLNEDHPDQVIIVAGTNDVAYDYGKGNANPNEIAERILNIARDCRKKAVQHIHISSIIQREFYKFRPIIDKINQILRTKCCEEKFFFIDNSNIYTTDLVDGVHLNDLGNGKFISNLLHNCSSYNPYLAN